MLFRRLSLLFFGVLGGISIVSAQTRLVPLTEVELDSLTAFRPTGENWQVAGGVGGAMRTASVMELQAGLGVVANTSPAGQGTNLFSRFEHGDLELELEFILPKGGNSGVYLQGRYEVQLFDSWLKSPATFSDLGGIYQRWRSGDGTGYAGVAPKVNAARVPGHWQNLARRFFRYDQDVALSG